jgi:hypothetical protein
MSAEYWVVQHVADLFRNEPRNVGVIVRFQGQTFARFFGEDSEQRLDGRRIKALPYPDVYKQWVRYWRTHLGNIDAVIKNTKEHYRVGAGGMLTDLHDSDIYSAADHLYSVLVSDGGIAEALTAKAEFEAPGVSLELEIERTFSERALLARENETAIAHPIRRQATIAGRVASHTPAFSQVNGRLCVIESVDLTSPKRRTWRDHSGFVAYMFRDIADQNGQTERYTLVRALPEDRQTPEGDYALKVLSNESKLIDWTDGGQREQFIAERSLVAQH